MQKKKVSFSLIYFLIALILLLLLQRYFIVREVITISYSEFKELLKDRLVDNLQISKDKISGNLSEGAHERILSLRKEKDEKKNHLKEIKVFEVIRMDDPDLVKELTGKGISYTAI
ncbi:MAG: ATP-dependent metallopeptidase FtsH/Yme1/Tma family protein, partial [Thermodesulfovibrionales bacterium]